MPASSTIDSVRGSRLLTESWIAQIALVADGLHQISKAEWDLCGDPAAPLRLSTPSATASALKEFAREEKMSFEESGEAFAKEVERTLRDKLGHDVHVEFCLTWCGWGRGCFIATNL